MVARIANHSSPMSIKARPGLRKPKNRADHAALKNNCRANRSNGSLAPCNPCFRQTSQAARAMLMYSAVQTGPNTQLGGFQEGFVNVAYQSPTDRFVKAAPNPAVPRHTTKKIA